MSPAAYLADHAWLGGGQARSDVLIHVEGERIRSVTPGVRAAPAGAVRLRGLTIPGMANAHSHAFHRALRGRTHRGGGTFWTWRDDMYAIASRLTPDSYLDLARATYAEMALAGITAVGEFHYLHHGPGGRPYAAANAMGEALIAAAAEAGIRITLLDACYLTGAPGAPLEGPQLRFGDGDADAWAARASQLSGAAHARIGAAIHSVRAVPADQLSTVAAWAAERDAPLHVHLSEQRAENAACRAHHGCTPTELLARHGALGPRSTAVHATHLTDGDVAALAGSRTTVCMTPTTERDLADGIGPARELATAGSPLSLGSDSNAVIDLLEEARSLEMDERLRTERRGHWTAAELLTAATADGHACLGWADAGRIEAGALADLTTVSLDSVRLAGWAAGSLLESLVFAGGAPDVTDVVVGGRAVVRDRQHVTVGDVAGRLHRAIAGVTDAPVCLPPGGTGAGVSP
ncbi:formimidoylglutamate deiminase [Nocardioides jiangxiensis]|uniref:Formimidoylglutamate deiminase n=1 Tax=Nocardioides jiangxiensis TaxID=3064524 RepID=A0ABT9AWP9_9ACTN|nr:formimidoylglutamate deiminase [Nocardioides sp. WY-20]MDO7866784.1 formimidoylglutamate deiminase [Nocardioides sp. WY-20]